MLKRSPVVAVVARVPIAERAVETGFPVKREEKQRTVIGVERNIGEGVHGATEGKPKERWSPGASDPPGEIAGHQVKNDHNRAMKEILQGHDPAVVKVKVAEQV